MSLLTWLRRRFGNGQRPAAEPARCDDTPAAVEAVKSADPIEQRLDQMIQKALPHLVRPIPEAIDALRDSFRLQLEYPNEYVAWVDEWVTDKNGHRRRQRRILAHGTDQAAVSLAVNAMPKEVSGDWLLDYIRDPEDRCTYL